MIALSETVSPGDDFRGLPGSIRWAARPSRCRALREGEVSGVLLLAGPGRRRGEV